MNIKKTTMIVGALLLITACSDRDREYYEANIDEAEKKSKQCEDAMEDAFNSEDEKKIEALSKDAECNFAVKVYGEHKRKLARLKREAEKKKQEEKRLAEEEVFQEQYKEKLTNLKSLAYTDFYKMGKGCGAGFMSKKTPECSAYKDLREETETREVSLLKEKYNNGKLEEFRDASCKGVDFDEAYCAISRKAAKQQNKERVEYYVSNREELKTEFNKCQSVYSALRKKKKWKESNESIQTYQCKVVGDAARKLNVFSFNKPIG